MRRLRSPTSMEDGYWLLTLVVGDTEILVADRQVDALCDDGSYKLFHSGLSDVAPDETIGDPGSTGSEATIPIEVVLPVDVAQMIEVDGLDLSAATAELAWLPEGSNWDDRIVQIVGTVSTPEYGEEGEQAAFSIISAAWEDQGTIPDGRTVNDDTFGSYVYPDASEDQTLPFVFGRPGVRAWRDGTEATLPGSPAFRLEGGLTPDIVVAGHWVYAAEAAVPQVTVFDDSGNQDTCVIRNDTDDTGQPIAVAEHPGGASSLSTTADEYWASWNHGGAIRAGWSPEDNSHQAGTLLRLLLRQYTTLPIADARFAGLEAWLNRFHFGGYVDKPGSAWALVRDELLPLLPLTLAPGPDGIYPVAWRFDATEADAIAHLVEGENATRTSRVRYLRERTQVANAFRLEYAIRADSGKFRRNLTLTPDADDPDPAAGQAPLTFGTALARVSKLRYGLRSRPLSSAFVWEDQTAALILLHLLRLEGFIPRGVQVEVGPELARLRPGDIVTYTDSGLSMDQKVAIIQTWGWSAGAAGLQLFLVEDPVRDRRVT